ncbi:MAG: hypothetical protein U9Q74_06610 [Gemmatimonadota bacterium]|nr:hypothetical protein [Gemmatimonadota bacterium]
MRLLSRISTFAICAAALHTALPSAPLAAQGMDHSKMGGMDKMGGMMGGMAMPGQAAFATIQDVVKKLKADPNTDWSKVNLEALRQHLIDMDNVMMRAKVKQVSVDGGMSLDITGAGDVEGSIRRMGGMHAMALTEEGQYVAKSSEIPGGIRLVVTAKDPRDAKAVTMVRALGFSGTFTEGDHHAMHHMMIARGEPMMHDHKP